MKQSTLHLTKERGQERKGNPREGEGEREREHQPAKETIQGRECSRSTRDD